MKWENNQLRVILSTRIGLLKIEQQCAVCSMTLHKGDKHRSFSIVDRMMGTIERWYTCEEHTNIFNDHNFITQKNFF